MGVTRTIPITWSVATLIKPKASFNETSYKHIFLIRYLILSKTC